MKPGFSQKSAFYGEMAKLLESGFGIREAADLMRETGLPASQALILEGLMHGLNEGRTISEAFGADENAVSALERGMIAAGERGGRLASAMRHLASYCAMMATTRREMLRGLIHPLIVLHLGVFIATVPSAMIRGTSGKATIVVDFLTTLLLVYAIAGLGCLALRRLIVAARTHPGIDRLLGRIPLFGKVRQNLAMAGFSKVYHIGLLAGIPMREVVASASEASGGGALRDAGVRLARAVTEGQALGPAFLAEKVFPKAFSRSYATGEAAGTLDKDLEHWSAHFQTESESGIRVLSSAVPRFLYLLGLLYAAWRIVLFYQDYYGGLLDSLQ